MGWADAVVAHGAILKVVVVGIALEALPAGGHEGTGHGEIIFGAEIEVVVVAVDAGDVGQKVVEGADVAPGIGDGGKGLAQLDEGLDAGEYIAGLLEATDGYLVESGIAQGIVDSTIEEGGMLVDEAEDGIGIEAFGREALLLIKPGHKQKESGLDGSRVGVLTGTVGLIGRLGVPIIAGFGEEDAVTAVQPCDIGRAQSKKPVSGAA